MNAINQEFELAKVTVEELLELLELRAHIRVYLEDSHIKHYQDENSMFLNASKNSFFRRIIGADKLSKEERMFQFFLLGKEYHIKMLFYDYIQ